MGTRILTAVLDDERAYIEALLAREREAKKQRVPRKRRSRKWFDVRADENVSPSSLRERRF